MTADLLVLFGGLLGLLALGVPVFLAMGGAAAGYMLVFPEKLPSMILAQGFVQGLDSFGFAAIPFFLLAGELMAAGGLTARLIGFARAMVGHWRGGLAQTSVAAHLGFAGVSGSAVADAAAVGSAMIPAMRSAGYPPAFAAALNACGAVLGPIIPPSIPLLLFALITNLPLLPFFLGGILPGLAIAAALSLTCAVLARRRGFAIEPRLPWKERAAITWAALPALLMPLVVVVALRGGAATASEVGAVLVGYALLVGALLYRGLTWSGAAHALAAAARDSARVLVIVSCAGVFGWIMAALGLGTTLAQAIGEAVSGPVATMLLIGAVVLLLGLVLDPIAILLICGPVLLPTAQAAGIDPVQFGVALAVGSTIGLVTPPVGVLLFLGAAQAGVSLRALLAEALPFLVALLVVFGLVLLVPAMTLALPRWLLP